MVVQNDRSQANAAGVMVVVLLTAIFGGSGIAILWSCMTKKVVLMCAFSLFMGGYFLGFLFGFPLAGQTAKQADGKETGNGQDGSSHRINTNLEQISDWLTKIIVGVGLVEIQKIYAFFQRAVRFMAAGLGITSNEQALTLAAATIIFFMILGFLAGYILTRTYLTGFFIQYERSAYKKSDVILLSKGAYATIGSSEADVATPTITNEEEQAATRLAKVSFNKLGGAEDYAAWAKAQFLKKNYSEAIKGYAMAVSQFPDELALRLEYANVLEAAGSPPVQVREQLIAAYRRFSTTTPEHLMAQVYNALIYKSLYLPPPKGFEDAIKYGEEYIAKRTGSIAGSVWVNLASAYGQKCSYMKNTGTGTEIEFTETRQKAMNAVSKALASEPQWRDTFKILLHKNYIAADGKPKDPVENDLEVFEGDVEFEQLVG